ncbi:unnamed protein product [Microthlaspi erraticum]|uniref:F-box/LRR-repeat protein 15/At3g58940/PEG3-like LRR domain-containing protein n=1 Tax=Microthlaspi erraticum TaxID=1685480 RepID=A0A6D2JIT6_9BRAS|nr:unnamed protein product [Microthlaspi erraticum]
MRDADAERSRAGDGAEIGARFDEEQNLQELPYHLAGCSKSPQIKGAPDYAQIEGAPNYRQAGSLPVHGVAIPTSAGMRNLLTHIGAHKDGKKIIWIGLSYNEPVVYINGRPFVLRSVDKPFTNPEYTEIVNNERLEQQEMSMIECIREEASKFENLLLVTDEVEGQLVDQWETISTGSLKTLKEVHAEEGLVGFECCRITEESSPRTMYFDTLIQKISQADNTTDIVFNCQTGRGHTTMGMVVATLIYFKRTGALGSRENESVGEGKRQVDKAIDHCGSVQNLLEAIQIYRTSILNQVDEKKKEAAHSFFVEYLERYHLLICFAVYLLSQDASLQPGSRGHVSFADWMEATELNTILSRRDPLGALGYAQPSLKMRGVAGRRSGTVLRRDTVLKSDLSPFCPTLPTLNRDEKAPNYRRVGEFPVYGVGNPTSEGIQSVYKRVRMLNGTRPIFWLNLREETVVYINGEPYVVRDIERPYKNMREDKGIDEVEEKEAILKEEVVRESRLKGGIYVMKLAEDGSLFESWESVNADSVKTPKEVHKTAVDANGSYAYARVPMGEPNPSDFDTLAARVFSTHNAAFVFNGQIGRGKTTFATVIACLVKVRMDYGIPIMLVDDDIGIYGNGNLLLHEETRKVITRPGLPIIRFDDGHRILYSSRSNGMDDTLLLTKLTGLFDNGVESREALDTVIDTCGYFQNIREAVMQYALVFNQQHLEPRVRSAALERGTEYLERYLLLIAFVEYLGSKNLELGSESRMNFKDWLHQRPEVEAMRGSIRLRPGRFLTMHEELRAQQENAVMESSKREALPSPVEAIQGAHFQLRAKIDPIKNLSQDMMYETVSRLSAKDVALTASVSKHYYDLCAQMNIMQDVELEGGENMRACASEICALPKETRVRRFSVNCSDGEDFVLVNKCLCHVLKLGVMEIRLVCGKEYTLPMELFRSDTLTTLNMGKGFVVEFVPEDAWLPTLESITMDSLRFLGDNNSCVFQKLLSACPVLEELTINGMAWETWIWSGKIASKSLQRLCIQRVFPVEVEGFASHDQRIVFDTPGLSQLYYADLVAHEYQANFGSLEDVTLKLQLVFNLEEMFGNPNLPYLHLSSNARGLLRAFKGIKKLCLSDTATFQSLVLFKRSLVLNNLEDLEIIVDDVDDEEVSDLKNELSLLLEKAPKVETLSLSGIIYPVVEDKSLAVTI